MLMVGGNSSHGPQGDAPPSTENKNNVNKKKIKNNDKARTNL